MGAVGMSSTLLPEAAFGLHPASASIVEQAAGPGPDAVEKPKYSIKFGVIGLDHYHIMGITAAVIRGGGELVSFYSNLPKAIADFQKLYPNARLAKSEDEILDDPSLKLIAGAPIPRLRAPLGIRAMKRGKDFLSDKPGDYHARAIGRSPQSLSRNRQDVRHYVLRAAGGARRRTGGIPD